MSHCAYLQIALDNPELFEFRQKAKPLNFSDGLTDDAKYLKVGKMVQADHPWIASEEHFEGDARQAFLPQSTVHHTIAGTLATHAHTQTQLIQWSASK